MALVIFDLDGTLVDSVDDLCNSVNAARAYMGLPPLPHDLVASYVGNGAPVLIRRAMGPEASEEQVQEALSFFLSYYREHMLDHTRPYPGVVETLETLHGQGVKMAVLTNKPQRFSRDLCAGLGLAPYFFQIYGGNSFEQKKPDPIGIRTLMQEAGAKPAETWMVGDSATDVLTARNAGVRSVGVTYGISPQTLKETPPDFLIDSMTELPRLLASRP
ncbi:MAG: phosphoglycolate phosphatase [Bryobacteraceae bacterium]|nr:phosphoglycolate phosphatase [Bryobacteraceae bacterium]MCX7604431.1 phosphoglycolate phosphatase [Bryobacteraceae bacterium]